MFQRNKFPLADDARQEKTKINTWRLPVIASNVFNQH